MALTNRNPEVGTKLVARYKKEEHRAEVVAGKEEGKVAYRLKDGRTFTSPSAAGSAVMGGVACNGWRFWSLEGDEAPKSEPKAKAGAKAKGGKGKPKGKAKKGNPDGEKSEEIACGDCRKTFPNSHEAADHMRKEHGSVEAPGSGGA